jgi:hypothetical protein
MENKFEFQNESQFENAYENLIIQTDFKRLADKFTVKPFYFKYKPLKKMLNGFTWFIQLVTIAVSFMAIFALLVPMMPYSIACVFAGIALVGIEFLKRMTVKPSVKDFLQFKKVPVFPLTIALSMLGVSLWLTWNGTHDTVFTLTEKPTLLNVDSLTNYEKDRISELTAQLKDIKKTQSWKGVLTQKGQGSYNRVTGQIEKLQNKLDEKESDLTTKNERTEADHLNQTTKRAKHFKYLTLCLDLLLFALLAWLEYYDFRSLTEFAKLKILNDATQSVVNQEENITQSVVSNTTQQGETTQSVVDNALRYNEGRTVVKGFLRGNTTQSVVNSNVMRSQITTQPVIKKPKIINGEILIIKKACDYCGESFERKVTFQRFCTEKCRIKAWENKTGKKVRKARTAKI